MPGELPSGDNKSRLSKLKLGSHVASVNALKLYSESDIKSHNTESDCWMIIHGLVYDTSKFLEDHPGGPEIMISNAGTDATNEFEQVFHSQQARTQLSDYLVGMIDTYNGPLDAAVNSSSQPSGSSTSTTTQSSTNPAIYAIPVIIVAAAVIYQFVL